MNKKYKILKNNTFNDNIKIEFNEMKIPFTTDYENIKSHFKYKNIVYINHIQHNNGFIMGSNKELYPDSELYELYIIEKIDDITYVYYHYHYECWYLNVPISNKKEYLLNYKELLLYLYYYL